MFSILYFTIITILVKTKDQMVPRPCMQFRWPHSCWSVSFVQYTYIYSFFQTKTVIKWAHFGVTKYVFEFWIKGQEKLNYYKHSFHCILIDFCTWCWNCHINHLIIFFDNKMIIFNSIFDNSALYRFINLFSGGLNVSLC